LTNLFVSQPFKEGEEVFLTGEDHHYLYRVLRVSPGDKLNLLDGKGGVFLAEIKELKKKETLIGVGEKLQVSNEPGKKIHLLQALPKKDRFEYILEKGTEIGIASFFPLHSRRTIKKVEGKNLSGKLERWQNIIKNAAQQSGRTVLPQIKAPLEWEELQDFVKGFDVLLWAWEGSGNSVQDVLKVRGEEENILLVIGPEGSFTGKEEKELLKMGFSDFSLGKRILRSDTAGLVAATIILHLTGDLGE